MKQSHQDFVEHYSAVRKRLLGVSKRVEQPPVDKTIRPTRRDAVQDYHEFLARLSEDDRRTLLKRKHNRIRKLSWAVRERARLDHEARQQDALDDLEDELAKANSVFDTNPNLHTLIDVIIAEVCHWHSIRREIIIGQSRYEMINVARQHLFYALRTRAEISLERVGKVCGNRDHSTVLSGIKQHCKRFGLLSPPQRTK